MKSRKRKLSSSRRSYTFRAAAMLSFFSLLLLASVSNVAATDLRNIDSINTTAGGELNISANTTFDNYRVDNISELQLNNGLSFNEYTINDSGAISPILSYDPSSNEWFMEGQNLNLDTQTAYNAEEFRGKNGTNSDPLYTFKSDSNTGIYSPNDNEIALTTNGNRGLELTSDSKVQVVQGNLQLGSNSISQISKLYDNGTNDNFFEDSCSSGDIITGINANGSLDCTSTENQVTDIWVNESGDTMQGALNMTGDQIVQIGSSRSNFTSSGGLDLGARLDLGSNDIQSVNELTGAAGTTSSPLYTFTGDTNTGIYSPGSNQLALTTDGTRGLEVTGSRNVQVPNGYLAMQGNRIVAIGSDNTNFTSAGGLDMASRIDLNGSDIQDAPQLQNDKSVDIDIDSNANDDNTESFEISRNGDSTDLVRVNEDGKVEILQSNLSLNKNYITQVKQLNFTSGTTLDGEFDVENSNITLNENYLKNATGVSTDRIYSPNDASILEVQSELSLNDNAVKDVSDLELNAGADIRTDGTDAIQINSDQDLTIPNGNISMSDNDIIEVDELRTGGGGSDVIAVRDANNEQDIIRFNEGGDVVIPPGNLSLGGNDLNSVDQIRVTDSSDPAGKQLIQVGDEVYLTDVDTSNTLGVYGQGDNNVGKIQLGSSGPTLEGQSDGDTNISGKVIVGGDQIVDSSDTDILTANIGGQRNLDDGSGNALLTVGGDVSSSTAGRVTVGDSTGTDTARFLDNNRVVVPNNNLTLGDGSGNEDFEINTDGSNSGRLSFQETGTTELQYRYDASNDRVLLYNPQGGNDVIRLNENGNVTVPSGALTLSGSSLDFTQGIGGNELEYDSSVEDFSIYDTDLSANAIAADGTAVRLRDPNDDEQAINIQSAQTQITNQPLIFDGENLDMNGSQIKNVDTLGNGTTRTIELESDGDVKLPNGNLTVGDGSGYEDIVVDAGTSSAGRLNFQEGGTTELQYQYDASNDRVLLYNPQGNNDVIRLNEGGAVEVPNGNLDVGNNIRNSGDTVIYSETDGELRATPGGTSSTDPVFTRDGDQNSGIAYSDADQIAIVTDGTQGPTVNSTQDLNLQSNIIGNAAQIGGARGGNSNPLIVFDADQDTGLYSPGEDQVALSTGGTRGIELTGERNVQIPNGNLQMNSNSISGVSKLYDNGTSDNFFEDSCSSGDIITGINANGSLDCTSTENQITDLWVNESGDTMQGALNMTGDQIVQIGSSRSNFTSSGGLDLGARLDAGNNNVQNAPQLQNDKSVDIDIDSNANDDNTESFEISRNGDSTDLVRVNEDGKTEILQGNLSLNDNYLVDVQQINLTSGTTIDGSFDIENSNITLNENYLKNATGVSTDRLYAPGSASEVDLQDDLEVNGNEIESNDGSEFTIANLDQIDDGFTVQGDVDLSNNNLTQIEGLSADSSTANLDLKDGGKVLIDNGNLNLSQNDVEDAGTVTFRNGDSTGTIEELSSDELAIDSSGNILRLQDTSDQDISAESNLSLNENYIQDLDAIQDNTGTDTINLDGSNNVEISSGNLELSSDIETTGGTLIYDQSEGEFQANPGGTSSTDPIFVRNGDSDSGLGYSNSDELVLITGGSAGPKIDSSQNLDLNSANVTNADQIKGASGSSTDPLFTFDSDSDSGIYRIGADQLGVSTGGTSAVQIDGSRNVKIMNGELQLNSNNITGVDRVDGVNLDNPDNAIEVNSDGRYQVISDSLNDNEVQDDSLTNGSIDSSSDFTVNNFEVIGNLKGTNIVNSGNIDTGAVTSSEISDDSVSASDMASNAINSSNEALDSSVAGNEINYNSGALGVDEGAGSGLNADQLEGKEGTYYNQSLSVDTSGTDDTISIDNRNSVTIDDNYTDADADPTNEYQGLEEVLENSSSAGDDNINMNGENVNNVNKISGDSAPVAVSNDVNLTGSTPEIDLGSGTSVQRTSGGDVVISD